MLRGLGKTLPRGNGGFSLVEVMFAMTVIAVALMGSVALTATFSQVRRVTEESQIAATGARQMLDTVRGATFSSVYSTYNNYNFQINLNGDAVNDLKAQAADSDNNVGKVTITQVGPAGYTSSLLKVDVTVAWNGILGNRSYQVSTYVSNRPGS